MAPPEPPSPPGQIFADGFECGDLSAWNGGSGCPPEPIGDVVVAETYTYGGVGGRVSQRDAALTLNGSSAGTFTQGWAYTDLGNVASVTYPRCTFTDCTSDGAGTSRTVSYGYARDYPSSVTGYASITYHPNNLVHTVAHTNGVTDTQAIDPNGMARPAAIEATRETASGTTTHWASGTYAYDGAGNITEIGRAYYLYDPVNRLTTGAFPTDRLGTGTLAEQTYVYDTFGNIQSIGGTSGRMTPTSSATNRLLGTAVYDAAGNLTHWNGNDYEYDAFNMMTRMTSGEEDWLYVYTTDGERVWQLKLTAGTPFHRFTLRDLSGKVLREYSSTDDLWVVERDYVYRGGLLLAAETPEGRRRFHLDHLGTPRAITNGSGVREAYHAYYPFGEEATDISQDHERMKFTGHERDINDNGGNGDDLDYMMARFCSPITSRFLSIDPRRSASMSSPTTWNKYAYAENNPLKFFDPDGKEATVYQGGIVVDHGIFSDRLVYWGENAQEWADNYNRTHTIRGIAIALAVVVGIVSDREGQETELPDEYWLNKKVPEQVEPGTQRLELDESKPSSRSQDEVYERTSYYDEFGRNTGRTDRTHHGEPDVHPNPHHHQRDPATGEWKRDPETGKKIWPGEHPDEKKKRREKF